VHGFAIAQRANAESAVGEADELMLGIGWHAARLTKNLPQGNPIPFTPRRAVEPQKNAEDV
jgi:hypothetical protein